LKSALPGAFLQRTIQLGILGCGFATRLVNRFEHRPLSGVELPRLVTKLSDEPGKQNRGRGPRPNHTTKRKAM